MEQWFNFGFNGRAQASSPSSLVRAVEIAAEWQDTSTLPRGRSGTGMPLPAEPRAGYGPLA